jgi:hypothetical protein
MLDSLDLFVPHPIRRLRCLAWQSVVLRRLPPRGSPLAAKLAQFGPATYIAEPGPANAGCECGDAAASFARSGAAVRSAIGCGLRSMPARPNALASTNGSLRHAAAALSLRNPRE